MWKWLVLLGLGGVGIAASRDAKSERQAIDLSGEMVEYLEMLAETTQVEEARCISHYWNADTLVLHAAYDTPWLSRNQTDSSMTFLYFGCPIGTAAWWHAHPWKTIRRYAARTKRSPRSYCAPSELDMRFAIRLALISIHRGMTCIYYQQTDGTWVEVPFHRDSLEQD